jgi:hypothetical protein
MQGERRVDQFVTALIERKIARADEIVGCSEAEVRALERTAGGALPKLYRDFLLSVGKGAGQFWDDLDWRLPDLPRLNESSSGMKEFYEEELENDPGFADLCDEAFSEWTEKNAARFPQARRDGLPFRRPGEFAFMGWINEQVFVVPLDEGDDPVFVKLDWSLEAPIRIRVGETFSELVFGSLDDY